MTTTIKLIFIAALLLSIIIPFGAFLLSKKKSGGFKASLAFNMFFFFGTLLIANIAMFSGHASAAETVAAAVDNSANFRYIGAALATGMSTIGAGIAVASSASAALGAISEDSSIMGKSLIFVALAEGVALYGLLISFMILNS